jgi:hypothetical protein
MKKHIPILLLLVTATFAFAQTAHATKYYHSTLGNLSSVKKICGSTECEGNFVNGLLILNGEDGRMYAAPDGTYIGENGEIIRIVDQNAASQQALKGEETLRSLMDEACNEQLIHYLDEQWNSKAISEGLHCSEAIMHAKRSEPRGSATP